MNITRYEIANQQGDLISITNFGARLISWTTIVDQQPRNIILGYQNLSDYLADSSFMGAIVGPYANRIAGASYQINEQRYSLDANEDKHQLHGGSNALANIFWQCIEQKNDTLTLECHLADGFNGYPGAMTICVCYALSSHSELTIEINVHSERTTVAGPTTHPYFNLNQDDSEKRHQLQIFSEHYTPLDNAGIPTGDIISVANTDYDFLSARQISNTFQLDDNFLRSLQDTTISEQQLQHAVVQSYDKKLQLHVSSNYPAMQVYTGQYLAAPFSPSQGICLEPQFCPNSPNQNNFPFHLTSQYRPLKSVIRYRLEK